MKIKLFTILCSLFFINTYAQIDFEEKIVIDNRNATNSPLSVFAADIDGDGNIDMLSASTNDNKIAWYKNLTGNGDFGNQQVISTGAIGANTVFAADIDGDGDIDVLSASYGDNKIAWYENLDGQGSFGSQIVISTEAIIARALFAADIDGDGDIDVVSGSGDFNEGKVVWYENTDGIGSFGIENIISNNITGIEAVFAADMDGDGDMDILSGAGSSSPLGWYENLNSQGQFGPLQTIANTGFEYDINAVDIDGDGDLDVISSGGDKVSFYKNIDGQGNFGPRQIIVENINNLYSIFPTDIDGDGDIDVVSGYSSDLNPAIIWNENLDGLGNFGPPKDIDTESLIIYSLFSADVDNDDDFDVLFASEDRIGYYENLDGVGNFGPQEFFTINVDSPKYIDIADIDGDGYLDVLSASYNDGEIAWYKKGTGNGDYGIQRTISKKNFGARSVQGVDIDDDGDIDVLYSTDAFVAWHENIDGNGNFSLKNIIYEDFPDGINESLAIDLDGDGDLDVLSISFMSFEMFWLENLDGTGNFGQKQIIDSDIFIAPISIDSVDVNNDGMMDILCASLSEGQAIWFENLGGGDFGVAQIITSSFNNNIDYIQGADFDNDNDIDVIITKRLENTIVWFENLDGEGSFGPEMNITSDVIRPMNAYSIDIDNDGDLDVVSASFDDQKIAWYENLDGLGNFGSQNIIKNDANRPIFVYADDVDADGDTDVFAVLEGSSEILWFRNSLIMGIGENATLNFSLYPNPSSDYINIVVQNQLESIEVYNNLGQLIIKKSKNLEGNKSKLEITNLNAGLYFIKVKTGDGELGVRRFLKK
ncbi:MAG: T9SS type A sorting domain-containing protein [Aequorivita sp.]|nr:T9SS type A sorting domain-containing protein [Aequorivita sp.]